MNLGRRATLDPGSEKLLHQLRALACRYGAEETTPNMNLGRGATLALGSKKLLHQLCKLACKISAPTVCAHLHAKLRCWK